MATYEKNIRLILPWSEPDKWVFATDETAVRVAVCSLPRLHVRRSLLSSLQTSLFIAKAIQDNECLVTWEAPAAVATGIALRLVKKKMPWVALGIIPKYSNQIASLVKRTLSRADLVTCFSQHDVTTLEVAFGLKATGVTPTIWNETPHTNQNRSKIWQAVGASNRDDITLAIAAKSSGINVNRYARTMSNKSKSLQWFLNVDPAGINQSFYTHQYQLIILQSAKYASGLSVAVRGGFAEQVVIASDTPHVRELIQPGETGLLVRIGDINHLAETIQYVRNGDIDVECIGHNLAQRCREYHTYDVLRKHIKEMVRLCT
jgi:hypothetical protein